MPTVDASARAMYFVAMPLAAPVRTWPMPLASMSAISSAVAES